MSLKPGTRLGAYEIAALIGAGGMGEVYRASDSQLKRSVAIKVLPASVTGDADRLARFQREAEVLAALNHSNIGAIYGLEKTPDFTALVMELVEGDDLSRRMARGAMPIDEALPIAKQIADALEAAHERNIIHRDLKPANIKVRADGTVKVLDFGLAKAVAPDDASAAADTNSPTLTNHATQAGIILGTAAYMAPEQAKGKPVDKRADIWSFGVVLHEMLTGRHLFLAETTAETLAHVMTRPVDLSTLPDSTPRRVRDLLARCLERDPRKRLRDIGEARIRLEEVTTGAEETPAIGAAPAPSRTRERIAWGAAAAGALLAAVAGTWALRPIATPSETRLEITTPATNNQTSFAISPDGRQLVFVASAAAGQSQLWLRPLDQATPRALAGTDGASLPFWSPDSRSVAFFTGNTTLKRLDIGGGPPQTLVNLPNPGRGGSWSATGVILVGQTVGPILRVPATGGAPAGVTALGPGQTAHSSPHILPGGRQFLFHAPGTTADLYLGSLDSGDSKRIAAADTGAQFVAPDWLLFLRQGTLTAQRVDVERGEPTGEAVTVADQVRAFSVSPAGTITYRTGQRLKTQFTWFDRSGKVAGSIGAADANGPLSVALSPDGRRVAAVRSMQGNIDLWLFGSGRETRLTFDAGREVFPVWSPDGSRLAFSKDLGGTLRLFQKSVIGGGAEERLLPSSANSVAPQTWSPDGRLLMYSDRSPVTGSDLWVVPLDGKQPPSVFVESKFEERQAQFSPDGAWVAYSSNESGRNEIYLRPFAASTSQFQVSTTGGIAPRWRKDGKELYYIAPDGALMAVPMATTNPAPEVGAPVALFRPQILYGGVPTVANSWQYDVAPDGRFLINVSTGEAETAPITVIQHWMPKP